MSSEFSQAFVDQFTSNVFHLSQQKGSRLRGLVRNEMQKGENGFYERIGTAAAQTKSGRHSDVTYNVTPHSKRRVSLVDKFYADLIDEEDKVRTLIDPQNPYSQQAIWSLGRAMDEEIINAAQGNAYEGRDTITTQALPVAQKLMSYTESGGTYSAARLNVDALRRAKKILDKAEVDPMIRRYCLVNAEQLEAMLSQTEVTSSDYNTVKALVQGEVDTFLGFNFVRSELVSQADVVFDNSDGVVKSGGGTTESDADHVICWASDGLLLAIGRDMKGKIDVLPNKHYSTQVYASMSVGATRLEDAKVVDIGCKNAA